MVSMMFRQTVWIAIATSLFAPYVFGEPTKLLWLGHLPLRP